MAVDLNVSAQIGHNDLWIFFSIHSVKSELILPPVQSSFWRVIQTDGRAFDRAVYNPSSLNLSAPSV
jgi:hypothetical protein